MIPFNEGVTKVLDIKKSYKELHEGKYALIELYCDNPECCCNGGLIQVLNIDDDGSFRNPDSILALINFSWGNKPNKSWKICLHDESPKTSIAKILLKCFKTELKKDKSYANSLVRHYQMIKGQAKYISNEQSASSSKDIKIRRNEPCPCGSGKKYKNCCLNK
jgi:hypothetical protein